LIGLITRTSGNNVLGLSVDKLVQSTNGDFVDIASSHDTGDGLTKTITASWAVTAGDGSLIPAWTQPTQALADTPGPMALL
jgi:hypothetical protein